MVRAALLGFVALVVAGGAARAADTADQPIYAPPADWVRPVAIPTNAVASAGAPLQTLLTNQQSRFGADGDDYYTEQVLKVLTPEGLGPVGNIAQTWDPSTETLTVHRITITRGDTVIDVLAGGRKMTVLRRETNLEAAMLDGRLTATIQPEGLQVGDIVDIAATVHRRDPVLKGNSADMDRLYHVGSAGRVYYRISWPDAKAVRWRVTDGLAQPAVTHAGGISDLVVDMANVEQPKPPLGAPGRFSDLGSVEASQFQDWQALSAVLGPLFDGAAAIKPGSPLAAEVAKIAASTSDPSQRALAALRLVETQTRYVFFGMNDGALTPADAETTWTRRFGDCKGKTVLLVAILRALGVDAEPVLVSTTFGDGMDARLPMAGWFDHVLVRAHLDGKDYWLDGTRTGDRTLDDLKPPPFHWGLPLKTPGAALARLAPTPMTEPAYDHHMRIDASKGPSAPAPTHLDVEYRGDFALALRAQLASTPRADYERFLRQSWSSAYPWLTLDKVDIVDDPATGVIHVLGDGLSTLDWSTLPNGAKFYRVPDSAMGGQVSFRREPGPHLDAPYAVQYPYYARHTKVIVLPVGGDFVLVGEDIDKTAAGTELKRRSRIETGALTVVTTERSIEEEFPAAEADADARTLRELSTSGVSVAYASGGATTSDAGHANSGGGGASATAPPPSARTDWDGVRAAADKGDRVAQYRLGHAYEKGDALPMDPAQAVTWLRRAADQGEPRAEAELGALLLDGEGAPRDLAAGAALVLKAAAQGEPDAQMRAAYLYANGDGVPKDLAQAAAWARKAADQGDRRGQMLLGAMLMRGDGAPKDQAQGLDYLRRAANQGLADAQTALMSAYYYGMDGAPRDLAQSALWARKAADQGDARGQWELGLLYAAGEGEPLDLAQAVSLFQKAAAQGNAGAEVSLGLAYRRGQGLARDPAKAVEWLTKAADQNDPSGLAELGQLYRDGDGVTQDYFRATDLFRRASNQSDPLGQALLGQMYLDGHGVDGDYTQARILFERAAAHDVVSALEGLGDIYAGGLGVARDRTAALRYRLRAAQLGSTTAMVAVGAAYLWGDGVRANGSEAVNWLQRPAAAGNVEAQADLGRILMGGAGVAPDYGRAVDLLRRAADKGSAEAEYQLGRAYVAGHGVPQDVSQATAWLAKAVDQNHVESERYLGYLIGFGIGGVAKDEAKGMTLLSRAADQGDVRAQGLLGHLMINAPGDVHDYAKAFALVRGAAQADEPMAEVDLGYMYDHGLGVAEDPAQAMQWYRKAADHDDTTAMVDVGILYLEGRGVTRDLDQATSWVRRGAEAGNRLGQRVLGQMYLKGLGVVADPVQAVAWLDKAAAQGDPTAQHLAADARAQHPELGATASAQPAHS